MLLGVHFAVCVRSACIHDETLKHCGESGMIDESRVTDKYKRVLMPST